MQLLSRKRLRNTGPRIPVPRPKRQQLLEILVRKYPAEVTKSNLSFEMYGSVGWREIKRINALVYLLRKDTSLAIETTNPHQKGWGTIRLKSLPPDLAALGEEEKPTPK